MKKKCLAVFAVCALAAVSSWQPFDLSRAAFDAALTYHFPVCGPSVRKGLFCVPPPEFPAWFPPEIVAWILAQ